MRSFISRSLMNRRFAYKIEQTTRDPLYAHKNSLHHSTQMRMIAKNSAQTAKKRVNATKKRKHYISLQFVNANNLTVIQ